MARTKRGIIGRSALAAVIACSAGCRSWERHPEHSASILEAGKPKAITAGQEADAQIALGRAAEQRGEFDQAMQAYRAGLSRDKKRGDAYGRLAVIHDKQGKFRESAELYRQALEASPGNPDVFCDMGYSLYLQRRWAEAEMNLKQAIALDHDHARAHNNLALVLSRGGRTDEALAEFRKAGCDEAQARENIAFALTTERRWGEARQQYQLALKSRPDSTTPSARLKQLDTLVARVDGPKRSAAPVDPGLVTTSASRAGTKAAPTKPVPVATPARPTPAAAPPPTRMVPLATPARPALTAEPLRPVAAPRVRPDGPAAPAATRRVPRGEIELNLPRATDAAGPQSPSRVSPK
jgi:tetratricopeptide (TPR) repeat protein